MDHNVRYTKGKIMKTADSDIQSTIRVLDRDTKTLLRKVSRESLVSQESMIWLLTPVFENGHIRSNAYCDIPDCVIQDGLAQERKGDVLKYIPFSFTDKGKEILNRLNK